MNNGKHLIYFLLTSLLLVINTSCKKEDSPPIIDIPEVDVGIIDNKTITPTFTYSGILDGIEIIDCIQTNDGGYIGIANSDEYRIVKFDTDFNISWDNSYGGTGPEHAKSIILTKDGGYLVSGNSQSNDGDVIQNHGGRDIWVCKLNSSGNLLWSKCYGGTGNEGINRGNSVLETNDGSFFISGHTTSNDGDISVNKGDHDAWLVKISPSGSIEFEKTYGGTLGDYGGRIIKTGNNYTFSVKGNSLNGDLGEFGLWVVQIDESGTTLWKTNSYGISFGDIYASTNEEIIVVNTNFTDFLLKIFDRNGNVINNNEINFASISNKQPSVNRILQTDDGGFLIAGDLGNGIGQDCILFRTNSALKLKYEKIIAGENFDKSIALFSMGNNSYLYQIFTFSKNIPEIQYSQFVCSATIYLDELIE